MPGIAAFAVKSAKKLIFTDDTEYSSNSTSPTLVKTFTFNLEGYTAIIGFRWKRDVKASVGDTYYIYHRLDLEDDLGYSDIMRSWSEYASSYLTYSTVDENFNYWYWRIGGAGLNYLKIYLWVSSSATTEYIKNQTIELLILQL